VRSRPLLVALFAAVLTIVPSVTVAQAAPAAEPGRAGAPTSPARRAKKASGGSTRPAPRKVLRLEEMKVEGRIQKPQAMFLMPRANLNYGELDRSEPVTPKIEGAVKKAPF
jgi:hypothetical protein